MKKITLVLVLTVLVAGASSLNANTCVNPDGSKITAPAGWYCLYVKNKNKTGETVTIYSKAIGYQLPVLHKVVIASAKWDVLMYLAGGGTIQDGYPGYTAKRHAFGGDRGHQWCYTGTKFENFSWTLAPRS